MGTRKPSQPLIFLVSGGILQIPAVFQANQLGLLTAVSDRNPDAPAMRYADMAITVDTWDIEGHVRAVKELSVAYNLVGVYSQGADVEVTVAAVAQATGLPGTKLEAALNCKNKARTRQVLTEHGLNEVAFAEVATYEEAERAVQSIGFPVIVKNVDNSASRGTSVVGRLSELPAALDRAKAASRTGSALIEKYLLGSEHSVDMIVYKGTYYPAGICDRPFSKPPFRVELGHVNPTRLTRRRQKQLYDLTEKCGCALGIDFGVAKADVLWTKQGPVILEMTNRLSGGFDSQYTKPYATGMNLLRPTMKMAIGGEPDLDDLRAKWHRTSVCLGLFPPSGVIKRIDGIDAALRLANVTNVIITAAIGDRIDGYRSSAERAGFVIGTATTKREALKAAQMASELIKFVVA